MDNDTIYDLNNEKPKDYEEKYLDLMVDLWVKDDAPEWIKKMVKEELRQQRQGAY